MRLVIREYQDGIKEIEADKDLSELLNMLGIYLSAQTELLTTQIQLAKDVMRQAQPPEPHEVAIQYAINQQYPGPNPPVQQPAQKTITNPRPAQRMPKGKIPLINPYAQDGQVSYMDSDEDPGYGAPGVQWRTE